MYVQNRNRLTDIKSHFKITPNNISVISSNYREKIHYTDYQKEDKKNYP